MKKKHCFFFNYCSEISSETVEKKQLPAYYIRLYFFAFAKTLENVDTEES